MNTTLADHIHAIGTRLTACSLSCPGIRLEPASGIIPRSLVFEHQGRTGSFGSVALGINPGQGDEEERAYYLEHGSSYDQVLAFWMSRRRSSHRYHTRTRHFIDAAGLAGPILWTEVVKCQNPVGVRALPPLETRRTCVHLHLVNEMAEVPPAWPIVAIGKQPFELAAMMFPSRAVIGIPHPTGAFGDQFHSLFEASDDLRPEVRRLVDGILSSNIPGAAWLGKDIDGAA